MDIVFTDFDGHAINGSSSYRVYVPRSSPWKRSVSPKATQRSNTSGVLESVTWDPLEFTLRITARDTATAYETWKTNVSQWFQPWTSMETRPLTATFEDAGPTTVALDIVVLSLEKVEDAGVVQSVAYEARVRADYPLWQKSAATLASETWTGSNGAAWPGQWTTQADASCTATIQGNAGQHVATGAAFADVGSGLTGMTAADDVEVLVSVAFTNDSEQYAVITTRWDGSWAADNSIPANGYFVNLQEAADQITLEKSVAGARTTLNTSAFAMTNATTYWVRFQVCGTTISYKIWAASTAEPDAWTASVSDSAHASGKVALSFSNGAAGTSQTVTWDDLYVLTIGESTAVASPVTNAGNTPAAATITLTTATHKQLRQCTVSGVGANGGMMGYPVRLAYTQASMTSGEVFAMVNGVNTPTYSDDYTAYIWTLVDTSQDAAVSTTIDLLTIDGVNTANPLGGRLEQGGMKLGDAVAGTDTSNTSWTWNDFQISQNPIRCGSWRPAVVGAVIGYHYDITAESAAGVTFGLDDSDIGLKDTANAMALLIGVQGNSLANLSRTLSSGASTSRGFVAVRGYGAGTWTNISTQTVAGTVTTSLSLSNAVEVACGVEATAPTANFQSMAYAGNGAGGIFTLSLNSTPTVTVGTAANADYYHGTFVNSTTGESIDFRDVLVKDGTLFLDTLERTIYTDVGPTEPIYGDWRFTDPDNPFLLEPGSNVITNNVTGATWGLRWRESYT